MPSSNFLPTYRPAYIQLVVKKEREKERWAARGESDESEKMKQWQQ